MVGSDDPCSRAGVWLLALGATAALSGLVIAWRAWKLQARARSRMAEIDARERRVAALQLRASRYTSALLIVLGRAVRREARRAAEVDPR